MLFGSDNFRLQFPWIVVLIIGTVGAIGYQYIQFSLHGELAKGSDPIPFLLGVLVGLIILFEMMLWPRKAKRRRRSIGPLPLGQIKFWMAAHIWLGLLTVPLVLAHSGLRFPGIWNFSTQLVLLFGLVITSGIVGWVFQQVFPRKMLTHLPDETIHSQIGKISERLCLDGVELVSAVCGKDATELANEVGGDTASVGAFVAPFVTSTDNSAAVTLEYAGMSLKSKLRSI